MPSGILSGPRPALVFLILSVGVSLSLLCQSQSGIQHRCPSGSAITLTFLISFSLCFSVFGQQCGIRNGEKMSLCCISTELILLGWLSFKAQEKNLQNKVIIGKGKKKVASWLPICSSGSPRPISATLLFCWDKNTTVPPPNTLMPKSGCVRLGNSSDTLIPWNSCQHPLKCQHLQQGLMGCGHLSSTSCSRDSVIWRKNQSCDKT